MRKQTHSAVTEWPTDMQYGERDLLAEGCHITLVYELDTQPDHWLKEYFVL